MKTTKDTSPTEKQSLNNLTTPPPETSQEQPWSSSSDAFWHDFRALFKDRPNESQPSHPPVMAVLLSALTLCAFTASAQTWQTVDDFKIYNLTGFGEVTLSSAMGKDSLGTIYAAGWAALDTNVDLGAVVRTSSDAGASWSCSDLFNDAEPFPLPWQDDYYQYQYKAFACDPAGNRFVGGCYFDLFRDTNGTTYPLLRASPAGSSSWFTISDAGALLATGAAADASGNIYIVGAGSTSGWTVRKGTPDGLGGITWANVDQYTTNGANNTAEAVFCHPTLGLFVVGEAIIATKVRSSIQHSTAWVVRQSADGGASWRTVDTYQLSSAAYASASGICSDRLGNLCAIGQANDSNDAHHWLVRKSSGGASWTTVDDFAPVTNKRPNAVRLADGAANGVATDASGNVLVVGTVASTTGIMWTVRKSAGGASAWQTVDSFQYASGQESKPWAIVADNSGRVYVGGYGTDGSAYHWLVRRLAP